jgi:anti-sigma factor ChrR (cupin superfamily)
VVAAKGVQRVGKGVEVRCHQTSTDDHSSQNILAMSRGSSLPEYGHSTLASCAAAAGGGSTLRQLRCITN